MCSVIMLKYSLPQRLEMDYKRRSRGCGEQIHCSVLHIPAATCICSNSVKEGFRFNVKFSYILVLYSETAFTSWLLAYINETE